MKVLKDRQVAATALAISILIRPASAEEQIANTQNCEPAKTVPTISAGNLFDMQKLVIEDRNKLASMVRHGDKAEAEMKKECQKQINDLQKAAVSMQRNELREMKLIAELLLALLEGGSPGSIINK